ncbi:hypothetical protein HYX10_00565 [Candidatus Woesearchaeota archaeon]|nr:hypothetical protein [Candidatus Woesearchaeota archaeon]
MAIESNLVSAAYFRDGALIRLSAPDGATLAEIDVLRFANVCGDNICQDQENYGSCSEDCPAGTADGYCVELQDNVCDPDCDSSVDADCFIEKVEMSSQEGRDDRNNLITYAIILVSVAVIAAVGLLIYKHARRDSYVY